MLLTIAIPTYDRNDILLKNLVNLLPQITDDCFLLIIDNFSPVPVIDTIGPLLDSRPSIHNSIIRNEINIGGSANIIRCFELCKTPWIWVLGDDDDVCPDAVDVIINSIKEYNKSIFIHFSSEIYKRDSSFITRGMHDFIDKLDSFSAILLISSGIYNTNIVKNKLNFGYMYIYSMAPHFATLIMSLGDDGLCFLSNRQIIHWEPPISEQQWSFINASLGFMTLLELPLENRQRTTLSSKIVNSLPRLEFIVNELFNLRFEGYERENILFLYDHIVYRLYYSQMTIIKKIKIYFYRYLLKFYFISRFALYIYRKLKRKPVKVSNRRYDRS